MKKPLLGSSEQLASFRNFVATHLKSIDVALLVPILCGTGLALLATFAIGFTVAFKKTGPYDFITHNLSVMSSLIRHGEVIGVGRRMQAPEGAVREFAYAHNANLMVGEGYYAIMGWSDQHRSYSVRLFDAQLDEVHEWVVNETAYSNKAQHTQNSPHAMEVLSDGSLLVSFDWLGLVARLDICSDLVWQREGYYHHSFAQASDGGVWTWYGEGTAYGQIQDIL